MIAAKGSVHLTPAQERAIARLIAWLIHVLPWQWWLGLGGAGVGAAVVYWLYTASPTRGDNDITWNGDD